MGWVYTELALVSLAAMLSPTTLSFSMFTVAISDRPLRAGFWFYVGALSTTLAVGLVAAFVLGDAAATHNPSTPKTWVAVFDVAAGAALALWVLRRMRRPPDPKRIQSMLDQVAKVVESRAVGIIGAGAVLANAGAFMPIALKTISETDPSRGQYVVDWVFFSVVSLLPLGIALVLLVVARRPTERLLGRVRAWLELHVRTVAAVLVFLVAVSLFRGGIAGLTG